MKLICLITLLHLSPIQPTKLLRHKGSVTLINKAASKPLRDVSMLFDDRYLLDKEINRFTENLNLNHEKPKKQNLMDLAASILKNAKSKGLLIRAVKLGRAVKARLGGDRALKRLNRYLNEKAFLIKYKLANRQKADKRKAALLRNLKHKVLATMHRKLAKVQHAHIELSKSYKRTTIDDIALKRHLTDLSYLPSAGGIPFPPVAVGGVNYHAPMNITVNALPYPNPNKFMDPYKAASDQIEKASKVIRG